MVAILPSNGAALRSPLDGEVKLRSRSGSHATDEFHNSAALDDHSRGRFWHGFCLRSDGTATVSWEPQLRLSGGTEGWGQTRHPVRCHDERVPAHPLVESTLSARCIPAVHGKSYAPDDAPPSGLSYSHTSRRSKTIDASTSTLTHGHAGEARSTTRPPVSPASSRRYAPVTPRRSGAARPTAPMLQQHTDGSAYREWRSAP